MARQLPEIEDSNSDGSCWTCLSLGEVCDIHLPWCGNCTTQGRECAGYQTRLIWPYKTARQGHSTTMDYVQNGTKVTKPASFSSFGLPPTENLLVQHFMKNIARIGLAIDYNENVYRKLAVAGIEEPAVLNALLAVSSSHLCRWQKKKDTMSAAYLRKSVQELHNRFSDPDLINNELTLLAMMFILLYEAFSERRKVQSHCSAIVSWLTSYGDNTPIDPSLRDWLYLLDSQVSLHQGKPFAEQYDSWYIPPADNSNAVDPIYGCSVALPKLLIEAAELYNKSKADGSIASNKLWRETELLQQKILATKLDPDTLPSLSLISQTQKTVVAEDHWNERELLERARNAAEICRNATHIFVYRITHDTILPASPDIQKSIDDVFELLALLPDAIGPGSMLGWALVIVGSEIDSHERRDIIRGRWSDLKPLGLNSCVDAERVLEEVWRRRDWIKAGKTNDQRCSWQQVMEIMGIESPLF